MIKPEEEIAQYIVTFSSCSLSTVQQLVSNEKWVSSLYFALAENFAWKMCVSLTALIGEITASRIMFHCHRSIVRQKQPVLHPKLSSN